MSRPGKPLPSADYPFLGMLLLAPMSAYDIKKGMQGSISHFYSAAHSQVYQQANRLVRDGYVREKPAPGGRRKRILTLTPKGRKAVEEWLRSPDADDQLYSELLVKVFFAGYASDPDTVRTMLEGRREHAAKLLAEYEQFLPVLEAAKDNPYPAMTLSNGVHSYRAEIAWIDETLAKLDAMKRRR
jgi:PadR family transcriptional regulator, regulatory protein AphA